MTAVATDKADHDGGGEGGQTQEPRAYKPIPHQPPPPLSFRGERSENPESSLAHPLAPERHSMLESGQAFGLPE